MPRQETQHHLRDKGLKYRRFTVPTPEAQQAEQEAQQVKQCNKLKVKFFRDLIIGVISLLSCLASAYNAGSILYYHSAELEDWWKSFLGLTVFSLLTMSLSVASFHLLRNEYKELKELKELININRPFTGNPSFA